jgi:hypothetical protein
MTADQRRLRKRCPARELESTTCDTARDQDALPRRSANPTGGCECRGPLEVRALLRSSELKRLVLALVRMHPFQVSEHDVSVEDVMMLDSSVLYHGVRDGVLLFADELASAARAGLFIRHGRILLGRGAPLTGKIP